MNSEAPIGLFDSGIGGISVYRRIRSLLPLESVVYVADQYHMPYGSKDLGQIFEYAVAISQFLLSKECKIIVIACNTACAAALHPLRKIYPEVLFVGMEPAVKPAAEKTLSGCVGVLATEGTFKGDPYAGVVKRFARGVKIYEQPCAGLAEAIEDGVSAELLRGMLKQWITPLKEKGIDQLALACTHYPLVIADIVDLAGSGINVIDPSEAIARRVRSLLEQNNALSSVGGSSRFYTTSQVKPAMLKIIEAEFEKIMKCKWNDLKCLEEF